MVFRPGFVAEPHIFTGRTKLEKKYINPIISIINVNNSVMNLVIRIKLPVTGKEREEKWEVIRYTIT
jgi:hypothetical protein